MTAEAAAKILVYYIELAMEKAGEPLNGDSRSELAAVVEAFRGVDRSLYELHGQHI